MSHGRMRGSRKFCQRGSNFDNVFFIIIRGERIKYHYQRAITGPPAKRHLNGNSVSLACRRVPNIECRLDSFVIFRGSRPVFLRNPIFCEYFVSIPDLCTLTYFTFMGVRTSCPPSGSAHD